MSAIIDLKNYLAKMDDFDRTLEVQGWDQQVNMPSGGGTSKSNQITALSEHLHTLGTAPELGKLIVDAEEVEHEDKVARALVRQARRNYDKATKLPADLVSKLAQTTSLAHGVWERAKKESDFSIFEPDLEKIIALTQRVAEAYGYEDHIYDPLIDQFEQDMTAAEVSTLFAELLAGTVPLVKKIKQAGGEDRDAILQGDFSTEKQLELGRQFMEIVGFDFTRGRLDVSTHPFCTTFGLDDVRITTRLRTSEYWDCISSVMHETGHAMYEQGIDRRLGRTPLGGGVSLGVHESQSRLWENLVGRSRPFWEKHLPKIHEVFPETRHIGVEQFYTAINTAKPSLIRTEADEVTYNLHVIIRFELEKALLEGNLKVKDLPDAWNAKHQEYLGVAPQNDAEGVLQDVHWSFGGFGYFPTYAIGNVLSVQLYNAAVEKTPGLADQMAAGEYAGLRGWLQDNIYTHGGIYPPKELIKRTTSGALDAKPYLAYLSHKYGSLYNFK